MTGYKKRISAVDPIWKHIDISHMMWSNISMKIRKQLTSPRGLMQAPRADVNVQDPSQQILWDSIGCCRSSLWKKKRILDFRESAKEETVESTCLWQRQLFMAMKLGFIFCVLMVIQVLIKRCYWIVAHKMNRYRCTMPSKTTTQCKYYICETDK